ncbi:MAG: hypothetical protein ACP5D2_00520 [Candidatus Nanoarchaeia archaeon]
MEMSGCVRCMMACGFSIDEIGIGILRARKSAFRSRDDKIVLSEEAFRRMVRNRIKGRLLLNHEQGENYMHELYTGESLDGRSVAHVNYTPHLIRI